MADLVITTPDWQEMRSLAEQGVDYDTLSERYGVTYSTIAVRSHKEQWFTPDRVKLKLARMSNSHKIEDKTTPYDAPLQAKEAKKDGILAETWAQKGESLRVLSFETAVNAIKRSKDLITIETASDLKAAVHVARQAAGLDADAPAVSLNLYGGGGGGFFEAAGPVIEAEEPEGPLTLEGAGI